LRYISIPLNPNGLYLIRGRKDRRKVIQEVVCLGDCMSQMSALSGNLFNLSMHWSIADMRVGGQPNCGAEESLTAPAESVLGSLLSLNI
jgi:hypothetical protein